MNETKLLNNWNEAKFKHLCGLDVSRYVKEDWKGLSYIPWAVAYKLLINEDPNATYEVKKAEDNLPYFSRNAVHFVYTSVKAFGTEKEMYLPVMDSNHKAVKSPDSRQVNDSIQRCLVKNIALFGIGLCLYDGDLDLYLEEKSKPSHRKKFPEIKETFIVELKKLIKEYDIPQEIQNKWLEKFKVNKLSELSEGQLTRIIDKIRENYNKDVPF